MPKLTFEEIYGSPMTFDDQLEMMLFGMPVSRYRQGEIGEPVSAPTRVYRVELPNGNGPFNTGLPEHRIIYDDLVKNEKGWPGWLLYNCPAMRREQMGITERAFKETHGAAFYGCRDLRSVATWFPPPSRQYLAKYSAEILCYELPAGSYLLQLDSEGEVVFNKFEAKVVERLPITAPIEERIEQ